MAIIRLQQVSKQFSSGSAGSVAALDQIELTIPAGQTMSIVGPSGCGKSTLLRVVAGLETHDKGQVFFDEQLMEDISPGERQIGMVFQNYALYPHFKGRGNLSFFFQLRGVSDAETEERIRITSEIMGFGFKELLRRKPGTLSGGQQQRLAIGRAIVRNPRLFLFDEPLSNLDAKLRSQTRIEIKRLLHRFQITALYVTHDQSEAIALGDQIAVMRAGRIEQVGPFQDLWDRPVNAFVAGFLGTPPMNLLAVERVQAGHRQVTGSDVDLPEPLRRQHRTAQQLTLGIRPEAVSLPVGNLDAIPGYRLRGQVELVEQDFARRTQFVHLRSGDLTYVATAEPERRIRREEVLDVLLPFDQLTYFDTETEVRLS